MKTALITYHAAHNNGSFLQAFATQKAIEQLGHECDVIDFSTPRQQYLYDVYKKVSGPKDIAKNAYAFFHHKLIQQRHDDFVDLQHKALSLTPKFYETVEQLEELNGKYDVFVSGSDQIWNTDAWDYSDAYLLSFVHQGRKISYASSMGGHILDKKEDKALAEHYAKLLSGYQSIAVRELTAQEYLQPLVPQHVEQVLDPTLLIDADAYDPITDAPLVPVYVMFTGNKSYGLKKYGFHLLEVAAPNHYLSLIKNADYVLSASFHGTAFSIKFEKQFYVVRGKHNGKVNMDDRMSSLLKLCGLDSRQLIEGEAWDDSTIDYRSTNEKLGREVERSRAYLHDALKD